MLCTIVVLCCVFCLGQAQDLPDYIKPCAKDDVALNECAKQNGQEAIAAIVEGDATFNIPNMKPLKLDEVEFTPNDRLRAKFSECNVHGLDTAEIKDINVDLENNHASITLHIPTLNIQTNYDVNGRLLVLPISGQGTANITYVDGDYTFDFDWDLEDRDGEQFAKIKDHKFDYDVERVHYQLNNLFHGNKYLGDEMNRFLDFNWRSVNSELAPAVTETVGQVCHNVAAGLFEKIPYNKLFA